MTSAPFQFLDTPLVPGVTLLEASAGTGKTYALAALVLRLVAEEDIPIGQILVTTYTIPATAELRERIRTRLIEAVRAFDGRGAETAFIADFARRHAGNSAMRARLAAAVRDFDQAFISTIHGFCQRMLLECAFETRAMPDAEVIPDQGAIVREVAEDYWRRTFGTHELTPFALLDEISPSVAKLHAEVSAHPTAIVRPPGDESRAACGRVRECLATFRREWPGWRDAVRRLYVGADWAIGEWAKAGFIEGQLDLLDILANDEQAPLSAYEAVKKFDPSHIGDKRGIGQRGGQPKTIPEHPFVRWTGEFAATVEEFGAIARAHFLDVARDALAAKKDALGLLSFDDLLTRFHAAVERSAAVRTVVRARFRAALVDEFQDTDPIQSAIFGRIFATDSHHLFLIGDPKQAIFGFRGADLNAYLKARDTASRRFRLDTNHRSDAPLVAAVNALFTRNVRSFVEDIAFEPVRAARAPAERALTAGGAVRPPMRFHYWDADKPIPTGRAESQLPEVIASEIVRLLGEGRIDGRAILPRDCAVLCGTNSQCRSMQAALAERGVPAVVLSSANIFESGDACELHIVLTAIAQPSLEPAIRAALATGLCGFDAAALDALSRNVAEWESVLARFRAMHVLWRDRGFIQMFRTLLHELRVRERLLAQQDGERRLTNLLHLTELLHSASREFHLGPAALMRWFAEELRDPGHDKEYELRLERDDDAVKILTLHKSKGLEWPVVFCPFLWKKADLHDDAHPVFHDDDGATIIDLGSTKFEEALVRAGHERLAEQVRLLYVALTRARHECHVIWGRFKGCENSALMWLLEPPASMEPSAPAALRTHCEAITPGMLRRTIETIAASHPGEIAVSTLPAIEARRYSPLTSEARPGLPRIFHGAIDTRWRVSSFSALTESPESEGRDFDFDAHETAPGELRGIHAFPRGARSGICLHEIFERLDFACPVDADSIIADRLAFHDLATPANTDAVRETVRNALNVPLLEDGDLRLATIPRERTLRELEFHLPAAMLTARRLSEFTMEGLAFEPRRGVLKGFVDLIFEDQGQFHLLDWKSNWLGPDRAHYSQAAMQSDIAHHRYDLQWQLYLLALHRFLRARLPAYNPVRNLGTVFYMYVRGLDPALPSLGIHRATPDLAALERLDKLFQGS